MPKTLAARTPEGLFEEATRGRKLSAGERRLLESGLSALRAACAKPLRTIEVYAVRGLLAHVAQAQTVDEGTVSAILTARYGVEKIEEIPLRFYQDAIEYLVDFQAERVVN